MLKKQLTEQPYSPQLESFLQVANTELSNE